MFSPLHFCSLQTVNLLVGKIELSEMTSGRPGRGKLAWATMYCGFNGRERLLELYAVFAGNRALRAQFYYTVTLILARGRCPQVRSRQFKHAQVGLKYTKRIFLNKKSRHETPKRNDGTKTKLNSKRYFNTEKGVSTTEKIKRKEEKQENQRPKSILQTRLMLENEN